MKSIKIAGLFVAGFIVANFGNAQAEILAMMNYESKTPDQLKSLKLSGADQRREGIAIIEMDPESADFGKIVSDIPLDPAGVAHHIFYDRSQTKAYITALASPALQVMDLTRYPYRLKTIAVPKCEMAEDVIFDEANEKWYLTCMNSSNVIVGRVSDDSIVANIQLPGTYPHGLAVNTAIDRILVTSTVSGDLKKPDEIVTILKASTLEIMGTKKLSLKASPSGEAPVEILFVPQAATPTAYVTNMFGATLWAMTWNASNQDFEVDQAFDFATVKAGIALEIYFNSAGDRMTVTTGSPGHMHTFDISGDLRKPKLLSSIPTAEGAHHVAFTKDGNFAFVQNALLNLPGLNDGSITVIDRKTEKVIRSMTTLTSAGFNANSIVLLPQWNDMAGH